MAQVARLDVTLQPGQVTESVEVVGAASLLENQTSSRGSVIDQPKMVEFPFNGRDYNQLALLSPGVLAPTPRLPSSDSAALQRQRQPIRMPSSGWRR